MTTINWILEPGKFLSRQEAQRLIETAGHRAEEAVTQGRKVAIRDYFIIDLALSTGLRVAEIANLDRGDVFIASGLSSLVVRNGKGGKKRLVRFNGALTRHYIQYMKWKQKTGEPVEPNDPLILSSNTRRHMTTRAIQKVFKRNAARAGLSEHYSVHCCRHTFACHLYKASGYNLRLVQKQLGHARIQTTEVYADVLNPDMEESLEKLYA